MPDFSQACFKTLTESLLWTYGDSHSKIRDFMLHDSSQKPQWDDLQ